MRSFMILVALAACGGGSAPKSTMPAAKSECAVMAAHVADAVFTWKEPPPTSRDNVVQVITERCEGDQWTADARACFGKISDEASTKPCIDTLTKDQHEKVMNAMEARFDHQGHRAHDDGMEGGGAPPPAGAPPPPDSADPCEGGE